MTLVGNIRPDVSRRLLALAAVLTLLSACAEASHGEVDFGEGARFVPYVADSVDDVGLGASVAIGPDGSPFIAYLAFATPVAEGQVAAARPIGAPYVPGVFLATVSEGIWTRGAVEHNKPAAEPPGVTIPFGPQTTEGLQLTVGGANGTAVAVGPDGSVHLAWTSDSGVSYAKASSGAAASVEQVYDHGSAVGEAGLISRPGIALDADGNPWITFSLVLDGLVEVIAATPGDKGWDAEIAAETGCTACALPPTGIGVANGAPVVVFADEAEGVMAATQGDKGWDVQQVDGADGTGLAVTSASDKVYATYYAGSGSVEAAIFDGSGWTTADVAETGDPDTITGTTAQNTSVAVDANGTIWVAWDDEGIKLASGDGTTFQEIATQGTANGAHPAVAAGSGVVYLAWYDTFGKNLMVGALGDIADVVIANPSPSSSVSLAPSGGSECGADGDIVLDLIAKTSLFDPTCLVAAAGEDFEINLDNQDAGIPHNINIFTEQGGDSLASTTLENGPVKQTLKVSAMEEGSYYFQCDAHPTTMVGTLAVIAAKK